MQFTLFDSKQKKKLPFSPINEGKVTLYSCGPTVYDHAHLGHAKSALSFDLLTRTLRQLEFDVTFARNITDVDDKIIKKSIEQNISIKEITDTYTQSYQDDMNALGVIAPDLEPKATENIAAMIVLIDTLIAKDIAYKVENGDIYFDVAKDSEYGSLSNNTQEDRINRVDGGFKRGDTDFVLWKISDEKGVCFPSPFGTGRPGWHLECSAMINMHLADRSGAYQIDIHAGGADLFFPHHENEAAQTRCAFDQEIAKYWMHNGFVKINGEKMSKSLGNSFFLRDALKLHHPESLRYYLLSSHYRADFNFSEEDLLASKKRLDKIYRLKKRLLGGKGGDADIVFVESILTALSDDLNISKTLATIDEMLSSANEGLDANPKDKVLKKTTIANLEWIADTLGFGLQNPYEYFQFGIDEAQKEQINGLIEKRNEAKKAKDFETSDSIRDEILALGISIMDTPQGTMWEKA
jgi:cysteinyl-tRNA synthetase